MNFFKTSKPLDFVAIGDIVTDAFIRIKDAHVTCNVDKENCELCIRFGDKVPFESVKVVKAVGNCANAAVAAARLGVSAALITNMGNDQIATESVEYLQSEHVNTDYIKKHNGMVSNYHYVLWYDVERTILVKHEHYPQTFPKLSSEPKWIYLTSLGDGSEKYHQEIAEYLKAHPKVKLAFQPGTFQIKMGLETLKDIYIRTDIFFCNVEEAKRILKRESDQTDIKTLLRDIRTLGPKIAVITDGIKGAYASDGTADWFMPIYPHQPFERTGAGDAFESTFTAAILLGKSIPEALTWGPINAMSVVQYVGAQEGLLTKEKLEEYLRKAPTDFVSKKI